MGSDLLVRNERRLQTYFMQKGLRGPIKIGKGFPDERLASGETWEAEEELRIIATIDGDCERRLHIQFAHLRINPKREWFRPGKELLEYISHVANVNPNSPPLHIAIEEVCRSYSEMKCDQLIAVSDDVREHSEKEFCVKMDGLIRLFAEYGMVFSGDSDKLFLVPYSRMLSRVVRSLADSQEQWRHAANEFLRVVTAYSDCQRQVYRDLIPYTLNILWDKARSAWNKMEYWLAKEKKKR